MKRSLLYHLVNQEYRKNDNDQKQSPKDDFFSDPAFKVKKDKKEINDTSEEKEADTRNQILLFVIVSVPPEIQHDA